MLAALAFAACNSGQSHSHEHEHEALEGHSHEDHDGEGHEHHEESHNPGEIVFDEHRQELFGIESGKVEAGPFVQTVKAGGRFVAASNDEMTLVAPVSGTVKFASGSLTAGVAVNRGSLLATVSSDGVAGGDRLAKARAAYDAARAEYMRDSVLVRDNIVAQSHFDESRLAYINARLELEALSGNNGDGPVGIRSGLSGRIRKVLVANGDYVEAGQPVAVIAAGRMLELQADVPARLAAQAAACTDARFLTAQGGILTVSEAGGRVLGCSQNATDGYVTVSFLVPQTDGIVNGVYTDVWIMSQANGYVISVPESAVIEEQGLTSVFVRLDEDCFEKREVVLGSFNGERYQVLDGLTEGDEIVLKGAMHIKLAAFQAIPHGHSHNH